MAFLTVDADHPNSIVSCIHAARENARAVRESITAEMWEQVNKLYLMMRTAVAAGSVAEAPHDFFTAIKLASQLYVGITDATLSSGDGWHFGRLGRLLERADMTSRLLEVNSGILQPATRPAGCPAMTSSGRRSSGPSVRWRCTASAMGA